MAFAESAAAIGGLLSGASSAASFGSGLFTGKYQRKLNRELMRREDTAVQRRVKDMEAAGINPLLAAGAAASTGSLSGTNQVPASDFSGLGGFLDAKLARANIDLVKNQANMAKEETKQLQDSIYWKRRHEAGNMMNAMEMSELQVDQFRSDLEKYNEMGIPFNIPSGEAGQYFLYYYALKQAGESDGSIVSKLRSLFMDVADNYGSGRIKR